MKKPTFPQTLGFGILPIFLLLASCNEHGLHEKHNKEIHSLRDSVRILTDSLNKRVIVPKGKLVSRKQFEVYKSTPIEHFYLVLYTNAHGELYEGAILTTDYTNDHSDQYKPVFPCVNDDCSISDCEDINLVSNFEITTIYPGAISYRDKQNNVIKLDRIKIK